MENQTDSELLCFLVASGRTLLWPHKQLATTLLELEAGEEGAELLLVLAEEKTELCFKDQDGKFHALIHNNIVNGYEIIDLDSEEFEQKLGLWYHDFTMGKMARKEWKTQVIDYLKGAVNEFAKIDENRFCKKLYYRCVLLKTPEGYEYYYNLANTAGEIVKVTKENIKIIKQSPELILFRKLPDDRSQVTPDLNLEKIDGKRVDQLDKFLREFNFEKEDVKDQDDRHIDILKCYILVLFPNAAAMPINLTTGPEGGNKTTLQRMIASLIDPKENRSAENLEDGTLALTTELDLNPDHTWERFVGIHENYYTCFYNQDEVPKQIFNELCTAVTGYNVAKREHYRMIELPRLIGRRAIGLTAVHFPATRPDFLDRVLHSKMVRRENIKSDEQVWSEFYDIKPKILGYIFSIIQEFLALYDQLKREIKPKTRLANFEIQAEIMSRVLGNEPNKFQNEWCEKKLQQVERALEDDSLALGLFNYLKKQRANILEAAAGSIYGTQIQYVARDTTSDILAVIVGDTVWYHRFLSEEDKHGWWKSANQYLM